MVSGDEAHPSHVGSQCVYLTDTPRRPQAVIPPPKIEYFKLIGVRFAEFRMLKIYASDPVALPFQICHIESDKSLLVADIVVIPMVITLVIVVIILGFEIYVVKHNTEYTGTDIMQQLTSAPNDLSRAFAGMDDKYNAVDHRGNEDTVGERSYRGRIHHDMRKMLCQDF
jgi:hypothetical protein